MFSNYLCCLSQVWTSPEPRSASCPVGTNFVTISHHIFATHIAITAVDRNMQYWNISFSVGTFQLQHPLCNTDQRTTCSYNADQRCGRSVRLYGELKSHCRSSQHIRHLLRSMAIYWKKNEQTEFEFDALLWQQLQKFTKCFCYMVVSLVWHRVQSKWSPPAERITTIDWQMSIAVIQTWNHQHGDKTRY